MAGKKPFPTTMTPQQMGMLKQMLQDPYIASRVFADDRFQELAMMHGDMIHSAPDNPMNPLAAANVLGRATGTDPLNADFVGESGMSFTDLFDNTISGVNAPQLGDTLSASASANNQAQSNVIVAQPTAGPNLQAQARAATTTRPAALSQASNASATTPFSISGRETNAFAHHGSQAAVYARGLGHGAPGAYDVPNHPLAGAVFGQGHSRGYSHIDPARPESLHPAYRALGTHNPQYAGPVSPNMQMVPFRPAPYDASRMTNQAPGYAGPVDPSRMGYMNGQWNPGYAGPVPANQQMVMYNERFAQQQAGKAPWHEPPKAFSGQYQDDHIHKNTQAIESLNRVMTEFVQKVTSGATSEQLAYMSQNLTGTAGRLGASPLFNQFMSENRDPFGGNTVYSEHYTRDGKPTIADQTQIGALIQRQLAEHYREARGTRQAALDALAAQSEGPLGFGGVMGAGAINLGSGKGLGSFFQGGLERGAQTFASGYSSTAAASGRMAGIRGGFTALGRGGVAGMAAMAVGALGQKAADMIMSQPVLGASLLGGDPMTSVFNNFGGIASLRQGQLDREIAASPFATFGGYAEIFSRRENQQKAPIDYKTQGISAIGALSNFGAAQNVTQMVGMRPGTGAYHAARFTAFQRRAEEARQLEFPAFQLRGMMGTDMSSTSDSFAAKSALGTQLQSFADIMGLSPAAAMGQMYDALSTQGFRTGFRGSVDPTSPSSVGAIHPTLQGAKTSSVGGTAFQVNRYNRRGMSLNDLQNYQSVGLSPTQIGLAFSSQMISSNLNAIGLGGQQLLNQANFQNLTGQGATNYIQAALQMGGTYTSLGYNLGQRRSRRLPYTDVGLDYASLTDEQMDAADALGDMISIPHGGRRSSTIMGEIGAMQRSGQGAFAGQNAFGAYARMDLKMGKGGSRSMASNLFGGIAEQLHFASYIQRGLTPGDALDAMSFDTPGQTNRAVRGMLQGLPENLKRGILRGGYDLTPEEASMAQQMHGGRGPEETMRPDAPSATNFQTRIPKAQADLGRILDFFEGKSVDGKSFIDINKRLIEANRKLEQTLASGIKIDGMEEMVGEMMNLADYMANIYESNRTNPAFGGSSGFGASNQFGLLGAFIQELFKIVFGSAGSAAPPSGTYNPAIGAGNNFGQPRY